MKLSDDPDARARLRLLRMWLTPEQYREIRSGLEQVETAPALALRDRIDRLRCKASNAAAACLRALAATLARTRLGPQPRRSQR